MTYVDNGAGTHGHSPEHFGKEGPSLSKFRYLKHKLHQTFKNNTQFRFTLSRIDVYVPTGKLRSKTWKHVVRYSRSHTTQCRRAGRSEGQVTVQDDEHAQRPSTFLTLALQANTTKKGAVVTLTMRMRLFYRISYGWTVTFYSLCMVEPQWQSILLTRIFTLQNQPSLSPSFLPH